MTKLQLCELSTKTLIERLKKNDDINEHLLIRKILQNREGMVRRVEQLYVRLEEIKDIIVAMHLGETDDRGLLGDLIQESVEILDVLRVGAYEKKRGD